ncbi:MAG TPA: spore germination protein [Clostridia bacterium]|nr:spore germination protein [Clostridia bacterium]
MFDKIKARINIWKAQGPSKAVGDTVPDPEHVKHNMVDNLIYFQGKFAGCADFICKEMTVCGNKVALMMIDNMVDKVALTESVMNPLTRAQKPNAPMNEEETYLWVRDCVLASIDQKEIFTLEECISLLMLGFVIVLFGDEDKAISIGLQGFKYRGIEEPNLEQVLRGSREGFVEPLRINMSMVRRRVKNPNLKFEVVTIGNESKTDICLTYVKGVASESILSDIRHRLLSIDISMVLASGYIQAYFQNNPYSIFATVGTTERPDTLCGKLNEGRVGIIVDGTPLALYTPFLFVENFQNMDDYAVGPYYAAFTRLLKFMAFFTSVFVPGLYVAIGSFHQALLPTPLLVTLAKAEETTPFPLVLEALLMQFIYELIREAGLRLPKQFGFAINIVGALIVGEAAVTAGLIGAPMVIIVAITATTSLVTPTLYEPGVILRFLFIILAGMSGLFGITLGTALILFHLCSIKSYEIPFTAPLAPFSLFSMRDLLIRAPWKILSRRKMSVQNMVGSNVDKNLE